MVKIMSDEKQAQGIQLDKLIKWNKFLAGIRVDEKPLTPFANQLAFLRCKEAEVLYGGGTRGGKAVLTCSTVVTPFGMRKIGDLKVGDLVSNPDGTNANVIGIYPQGKRPVYKFTFQDGREVVADEEHLWKVRLSRKTSRKSNRKNKDDLNYTIKTTMQVIEWMNKDRKGDYSILVPLSEPVQFTKTYKYNMILIEPYTLGLILGDGCITGSNINIAGKERSKHENLERMKELEEWDCTISETRCNFIGKYNKEMISSLEKYGLMGKYSREKFIPKYYKLASIQIRKELVRGLMDTDGYVDSRGHLSYTSTSKQLAEDFQWVIWSLGGRANIMEKEYSFEKGGNIIKRTGYTVFFQVKNGEACVTLDYKHERRLNKEYMGGITDPCLKIEKIEYVGEEDCTCIRVSKLNGLFLVNDFIVTHNSVALMIAALQYVDIPTYNAIIFRKTYQELSKGDGLIPMSKMWLKPFEKEGVRYDNQLEQWEFPSGAVVGFGHMGTDNDKYKYIGQAYQFIGFDELTQQPKENYTFMFSRLVRNKAQESLGIPLRMRATTNPDGIGVEWTYDRFVNKRTRPVIREEIIVNGMYELDCRRDEVPEAYIKQRMPIFVPSLLKDNPYIDAKTYVSQSLNKLDPVLREKLLNGNWEIRATGNMFKREWFEKVPYAKVPVFDLKCVRYWDLAATRDGDATVGCRMGYDKVAGVFYILDMKILQLTPREVEREIYHCAIDDGPKTVIYMEEEPGSAGKHNIDHYKRKVIPPGWPFKADRVSGDKETRARPLSSAAEKDLIKIAWSRRTDEWYGPAMDQLEGFPEYAHDDVVDSTSSAFNALNGRMFHGAQYIGKIDWIDPTKVIGNPYGPGKGPEAAQIVDIIVGRKKF